MDEDLTPCVPKKFWVVACLALIWNLMGCVIFYGEMFQQEAMISGFESDQQAWVRGTPGWIYVIFCISVMTGVVGSVLLLLKSKVCIPLFGISFITVLVQMTFTMVIAGGIEVMGPSAAIMPIIVTLLAAAWLGFSVQALRKGWL